MRAAERRQREAENRYLLMAAAAIICLLTTRPNAVAVIEATTRIVEKEVRGIAHRRLARDLRHVFERMAEGE